MALKHNVRDSDEHFIVDASSRKIIKQSSGKSYLMQYDHNSEVFTFEVPLKIEDHDMSLCDLIQIHYENTSQGTSTSMRKTYRGVHNINKDKIAIEDDAITFSWLVPETATMFAGILKFQLKFICHDNEDAGIEGYKWHSDVNEDISVKAGLSYSADEMTPSTTATLQSLEIVEHDNGVNIILDERVYSILHGQSGVYVGSGEMPSHCNVQIDPTGVSMDPATMTQTIDENSTATEVPSAKAVHDLINGSLTEIDTLLGGE